MAAQAAAQLLDELMGRDRNLAPTEKKREIRWDDQQVCKHFLVKFCPNELFVNTRADLGPCDKIHDESLKNEYEKSSSYQKMGYEEDFLRFCQSMMSDVERRIRRGRQRLSQGGQEGGVASPAQVRGNEEKIQMLSERLSGLLEQVEKLGCEGKVEEAQGIMKLCDQLKDEREGLRRTNENSHWMQDEKGSVKVEEGQMKDEKEGLRWMSENSHWMQTAEIAAAQEKQMEVCEVCGAFLIVGDAQQRVDDHLMGKQHMGFAKIKSTVDEILNSRIREREEREEKREKEREERRKQREEEERAREKEREDRRKKLEEEKRKERERERRKRKRSRSRDRDRRRSRSRSRNRKHSRSRSRDRRRSSSHNRRSRSKDRNHSSLSKDDRRSQSRSKSEVPRKSRRSHSRSPTRDRKDKHRDSRRENERESGRSKHKDKEDRYGPVPEDEFKDNGNEPIKEERTDWDSPTDTPTRSVAEDTSPSNKSADGTKWQSSGWTEIRQRHDADSNGAKSEGDSEQ